MEFKVWNKEELDKFKEEHFIEECDWLDSVVLSGAEVAMKMDTSENEEGDLVIKVRGAKDN